MIDLRPTTLAIAVTALLAGATGARAQDDWIVFYPITGEVSLSYDGQWIDSQGTQTSREIEYEERLRLQLGGYSLDPRIFNFNINLEPALTQTQTDNATTSESSDGTQLDYSGRFSALHGVPRSPVSLAGNFSRSTDELDGDLGTTTDVTVESAGVDVTWKLRAFPQTLSYSERSLDEFFTAATTLSPSSTQRDETQRTLRYVGRSSKMEVYLQGIEFDGETVQTAGTGLTTVIDTSYDQQEARLSNNWRWGKGSRLNTRLTYLTREGFNANDRATGEVNAQLQHLENLYTRYSYNYEQQERTVETTSHRGQFELNHRLYQNLTTSFRLGASSSRSDNQFRDDDYNTSLDFYYRKSFSPDLKVAANLGGGYRLSDRTGGVQDFTESLVVPVSGIVLLNQRFIIVSTIVVTAPGCNPCSPVSDYLVEDAGGDFTQLRIPAGSAINIGDTITVDYSFAPPTVKFYGIPYRIGARVDYRWASFFHTTSGENQTFISGPDPGVVGDQRTDTTGIEARWTRDATRLSAGAERRYTNNVNFDQTEYVLRQGAYHNFAPNLSLSANLSQNFVYDTTDAETYNADVSVNWYPVPGLWVSPFASAFYRTVEPTTTERFWKVGVNTRWNWRRLGFELRYHHSDDETDSSTRVDDRLYMSVRRRF